MADIHEDPRERDGVIDEDDREQPVQEGQPQPEENAPAPPQQPVQAEQAPPQPQEEQAAPEENAPAQQAAPVPQQPVQPQEEQDPAARAADQVDEPVPDRAEQAAPDDEDDEQEHGEEEEEEEEEEPQDEIRMDMLEAAARAGGGQGAGPGADDNPFDGLEVLKGNPEDLGDISENELDVADVINGAGVPEGGNDAGAKTLVDIFRRKQIYKAVVLARVLEQAGGGSNGKYAAKMIYKYTASASKAIGSVNAAAGALDSNWKASLGGNIVGLITNFMGFVDAIKGCWQKGKKYLKMRPEQYRLEGKQDKYKEDEVLTTIGFLSDFYTVASKGVAMAQSIAGIMGKNKGLFKEVTTLVVAALNGIAQLNGIGTGIYNLDKAIKGLKTFKAMEEQRWEAVEMEGRRWEEAIEGRDQEEAMAEQPQQEEEALAEQPRQEAGAGEEDRRGEHNLIRRVRQWRRGRRNAMEQRRDLANEMLGDGGDIPDEVKDKLVLYLAVCRKIGRTKEGIAMGASSLAVQATGLASGIATGKNTLDETATSKKWARGLGAAAGITGATLSTAQIVVDAKNDVVGKERGKIQERLWNQVRGLTGDEYGLRGISRDLMDANQERRTAAVDRANMALPKYDAADKYFKGAFVDYDVLLKSTSIDEFKKMLVAGI